jgi:membrane protein implicated in regulation of membrane protease activity
LTLAGEGHAMAVGRLLVFFGLLVAAAGLLIWLGVPIGRLPGDILVRRGGFSFYIPVTTSIIASVVLTVLWALFRR